jgi:arylsulfatase A-like enzyme
VRDLYDGEIHYVDLEIGRLLEELRQRGVLERTLVIVTADHGESLGEHDYWFEHGLYAYENACRVPLIVRLPEARGRPAPGTRSGDFALADLAPTVIELVGAKPLAVERAAKGAAVVRGVSRAAQLAADDARPEPVFCEKVEAADALGTLQHKAVRAGDWKLVRRYTHLQPTPGEPRKLVLAGEELFDLARDPNETRDLSKSPPPGAPIEQLREELVRFVAADPSFPDLGELLRKRREALSANDREALRQLGYY